MILKMDEIGNSGFFRTRFSSGQNFAKALRGCTIWRSWPPVVGIP